MDQQGFRKLLQTRNLNEEQITASITMAERFEAFLSDKPPIAENAWAFSKLLIGEGSNTIENYLSLARYCLFIKNNAMYVAILELIDGGEVGGNLYKKIGQSFGDGIRDQVFSGIGIAPYGTPTPDKPAYMHPVIDRLEAKVGMSACKDFLSSCLRDLPDEAFLDEREKYGKAGDIDAYLVQRKEAFVAELEACRNENRLFYAQEITDEVLDFVRSVPDMGGGVRLGNVVYETKIPYQAKEYLAEKNPTLRRYYYCHCPWAREAIRKDRVKVNEIFCYCSAGFHKKAFDIIFNKPLKAEVLESVLKGDDRCRFAIHLPEEAILGK